ncbi:MAG TPA: mycofactocin oligosaccharide methyltransferase MftM [Pseudonocardia sp.]
MLTSTRLPPGLPTIGLDRLDNDLAGWLDRTLIRPGLLPASSFEEAFVAIVQASAPDPMDAWTAFYRNTIHGLARGAGTDPEGTIAEFAPVHERAVSLVEGADVLELGCCFGFLSLRLARSGHRVTALDLVPGTMRLLTNVAARLGVAVHAVAGDVTAVPLADGCADTVLAVHLLEHLPEEAGAVALAEMVRLARRRVVVAVPFEDEPNPTWGHLRCFDTRSLAELGESTGLSHRVEEHHGGWLILDR